MDWTPALLPELRRWLDASDFDKVVSISDPSTGIFKVDTVFNKMTNAPEFTGGAQRPDHVSVGGRSYIRFTPTQSLVFAPEIVTGTRLAVFFVLQAEGTQTLQLLLGNNNTLMMPIGASSSATNTEVFRASNTPRVIRKNGVVTPWTTRGAAHTSLRDTSLYQLSWVDFTPQQNLMYFGQGPFSYHHYGLLGEMIVCDGSISDADVLKIEGYLAHKWGLVSRLPVDHDYYNAAPTIGQTLAPPVTKQSYWM